MKKGPVHPRACGEHCAGCPAADAVRGSSPRMRGTHHRSRTQRKFDRFIPAHAGNTMRRGRTRRRATVHPRACGEHDQTSRSRLRSGGSSPRMRGTRERQHAARAPLRFIPAHAGNTSTPSWRPSWAAVHPRACGEHHAFVPPVLMINGSSPRMRGTRPRAARSAGAGRFIPAHAGNTGCPGRRW